MIGVAKWEFTIVAIGFALFLGITAYSVSYARAAVRDDLRKQDITNLKRAIEQYYNIEELYPISPNRRTGCTTSSKDSWFFSDESPLLHGQFIDAIPHDVRENKGFVYSYCVTQAPKKQATAFYLEARLESNEPKGIFFDEDEQRKFHYRVLEEDGKKLYRVCGGEEKQCKEL